MIGDLEKSASIQHLQVDLTAATYLTCSAPRAFIQGLKALPIHWGATLSPPGQLQNCRDLLYNTSWAET